MHSYEEGDDDDDDIAKTELQKVSNINKEVHNHQFTSKTVTKLMMIRNHILNPMTAIEHE